jgi:hypothetical protein
MKMLVYIEKASNGNCSLSSYKLKIKGKKKKEKKGVVEKIINKYRIGWMNRKGKPSNL